MMLNKMVMNRMHIAAVPALLALLLALGAPPAVADDGYGSQVASKFTRGLANTATGWVELPKDIVNTSKDSNIAVGMTWGVLKGVLDTVGRTAVGALELATFFVPSDEFVHPTYVWSDFNEDTAYGVP